MFVFVRWEENCGIYLLLTNFQFRPYIFRGSKMAMFTAYNLY
jgi:hypothetical protein